jgi:hypothetical protein
VPGAPGRPGPPACVTRTARLTTAVGSLRVCCSSLTVILPVPRVFLRQDSHVPEDVPVSRAADPSAAPPSGSLPSPPASRVPDVRQRAAPRLVRRLIIILGLLLIGLATGIWAIALFPSRPQVVTPASFIVLLANGTSINNIFVTITPEGPSAEGVELSASIDPGSRPLSRTGGVISLVFPEKVVIKKCPTGAICYSKPGESVFVIGIPITLGQSGATRNYNFVVSNVHFGFSSNGESAVADLPTVLGGGRASTGEVLFITYQVQGAAGYDWSIPPLLVAAGRVGWSEPLTVPSSSTLYPEAQPSEVTGINHAAEAQDSQDTFISGILLGVAGAAVIAGAQEGLHLLFDDRDDSTPRQLRRIRTQSP